MCHEVVYFCFNHNRNVIDHYYTYRLRTLYFLQFCTLYVYHITYYGVITSRLKIKICFTFNIYFFYFFVHILLFSYERHVFFNTPCLSHISTEGKRRGEDLDYLSLILPCKLHLPPLHLFSRRSNFLITTNCTWPGHRTTC